MTKIHLIVRFLDAAQPDEFEDALTSYIEGPFLCVQEPGFTITKYPIFRIHSVEESEVSA